MREMKTNRPTSYTRLIAVAVGTLILMGAPAASGAGSQKISSVKMASGKLVLVASDGTGLTLADGAWRTGDGAELVIQNGRPVRATFRPGGRSTDIYSLKVEKGELVFNGNGGGTGSTLLMGDYFRAGQTPGHGDPQPPDPKPQPEPQPQPGQQSFRVEDGKIVSFTDGAIH